MKNIFDKDITQEVIDRINNLEPTTTPQWGKMNVSQMLAHLSVMYEMVYTDKYSKPNFLVRFLLKSFVKKAVVSEKSYPKNTKTAPQFIINDERDFHDEKDLLMGYIKKTQELGAVAFDGKESHSFGPLTITEWNNMFYKHIDHHLTQFGV